MLARQTKEGSSTARLWLRRCPGIAKIEISSGEIPHFTTLFLLSPVLRKARHSTHTVSASSQKLMFYTGWQMLSHGDFSPELLVLPEWGWIFSFKVCSDEYCYCCQPLIQISITDAYKIHWIRSFHDSTRVLRKSLLEYACSITFISKRDRGESLALFIQLEGESTEAYPCGVSQCAEGCSPSFIHVPWC